MSDEEGIKVDIEVDCVGLVCPQPMLRTMSALKNLKKGQVLLIKASDSSAKGNIRDLCERMGCELAKMEQREGNYYFWIKR
ncbi:MAG: sulfurtransferase TusA family protein [Euryarchaeota archaeon]|nr:sulfurtransferase TusA family protein [Euryarchaeota archaeon]